MGLRLDFSRLGELDGVADEVDDDLPQAIAVARDERRHVGIDAIRIKAHATTDGARLEREVRGCQRRWAIANKNISRECRQICLAVRAKAPYAVKLPAEPVSVTAGSSLEVKATIARLWPEFKGKVQLVGLNLPPGFNVAAVEAPAGRTEATVKIAVAANVPPGTYTINLRGDAQVPFQRDDKSESKPLRVADPATPLTVIVNKK